jgi:hypothetical protein
MSIDKHNLKDNVEDDVKDDVEDDVEVDDDTDDDMDDDDIIDEIGMLDDQECCCDNYKKHNTLLRILENGNDRYDHGIHDGLCITNKIKNKKN